jgi:hypothetical protein
MSHPPALGVIVTAALLFTASCGATHRPAASPPAPATAPGPAPSTTHAAQAVTGSTSPGTTGSTTATSPATRSATSTAASLPVKATRGQVNLATVNGQDPTSVAQALLIDMSSPDSAVDTSPNQAEALAISLLAPPAAAALTSTLDNPGADNGGAGADWTTVVAHHGWDTATAKTVTQGGGVPDTATTADREMVVTVTEHSSDPSWTPAPIQTIWAVTLTRSGPPSPWKVSALSDLGAT